MRTAAKSRSARPGLAGGRLRPARGRRRSGTAAGREIIGALTELAEALESGEPLERQFTVRTVEMPEQPGAYDADAVKASRAKLGVSQAVFARLVGASVKLVQAWEIGSRRPSPMARRLFDEFNRDPLRWVGLIRCKTGITRDG